MPHPINNNWASAYDQASANTTSRWQRAQERSQTHTENEGDSAAFPRAQRHECAVNAADERAAVMHMAEVTAMVHVVRVTRRLDSATILGDGHERLTVLALVMPLQVVRRQSGIPELFLAWEMRDAMLRSKLHVVRNNGSEAGHGEELGNAALHLVARLAHARGRSDHRTRLHIVHGIPKTEGPDFGRRDKDAQRRRAH